MAAQREKVAFEPNTPVTVTLSYSEGKIVSGRFGEQVMYSLEGNQVMWVDLAVAQKINLLEINAGESVCICKRWNGQRSQPVRWDVWLSPATEKMRAARQGRTFDTNPEKPAAEMSLGQQLVASVTKANQNRYATLRIPVLAGASEDGQPGADARTPAPAKAAVSVEDNGHSVNGNGSNGHHSPANGNSRPAAPPLAQGWAQFLLASTNALVDAYAAALAYASTKHGNQVKPEDVRALLTTAYIAQTKNGGPHVA